MTFIVLVILFVAIPIDGYFFEEPERNAVQAKTNIALFFANYEAETCDDLEENELNLLNLTEVARVSLSSSKARPLSRRRSCTSCNENLKKNLMALITVAKNILNMQIGQINIAMVAVDKNLLIPIEEFSEKMTRSLPETIPARPEVISAPSHVETFRIRSKRTHNIPQEQETINISPEVETEPPSEILGAVYANIQLSFFGPLLLPKNEPETFEAETLPPTNNDFCLLEKVVQTVEQLQQQEEAFLLIVFGGNLTDIKNCNSALLQSLKFLTENTNCAETLILLTGFCPETEDLEDGSTKIPVFAKGPLSDSIISECTRLEDIPLVIKNKLIQSETLDEERPRLVRKKRYLLNIKPNKPPSVSNSSS